MTFVDDYPRMCSVYLLKKKYKVFQTFKNFHAWIENQAQAHIGKFHFDNVNNTPLMILKIIFVRMGLNIKLIKFPTILNKTVW